MALSEMYRAVEQVIVAVTRAGSRAVPSFGLGAKDIFIHDGTPRVTWMPIGGPVISTRAAAADYADNNPRPLWQRNFSSAAYIWAKDFDAAEELCNHVVAALDACYSGGYRITAEKWDVSGDLDAGNTVVITFEIHLRFLDEKVPVAQFDNVLLTAELTAELVT